VNQIVCIKRAPYALYQAFDESQNDSVKNESAVFNNSVSSLLRLLLSAGAACAACSTTGALQSYIDLYISCPQALSSKPASRRRCCCRSMGQTDAWPLNKLCFTAGSVANFKYLF